MENFDRRGRGKRGGERLGQVRGQDEIKRKTRGLKEKNRSRDKELVGPFY